MSKVAFDARTSAFWHLDAAIAFQLDHAMSRAVIVDTDLLPLLRQALTPAMASPLIIKAHDPEWGASGIGPRFWTVRLG